MKLDRYKYIVVFDNVEAANKRLKAFASGWCCLCGGATLVYCITTAKYYNTETIVNKIVGEDNMSCIVFSILTMGGCSAIGSPWSNKDVCDWFEHVCTNDINIIKEKLKEEETGLVPDSAIVANKNKKDDLYL